MRAFIRAGLFLLLISITLVGCTSPGSEEVIATATESVVSIAPPAGTDGYPWWNDTIFYEVFIRSFYDGDGDAVGDFKGLLEKLDYLQELGITGIYLMPIYPSGDPAVDSSGYRVEDYLAVNSDYGTLNEFRTLVAEIHKHGMRVIIDLVLNHTSANHPWFEAAQDPDSPYRDYYIWSDSLPASKGPWGQEAWFEGEQGYYFATFGEDFPDLNYENSTVTEAIYGIVKFWLTDIGIDGFRLDAAQHLIEEDPNHQVDTGSTHQWYADFRSYVKGLNPDALLAGEVWNVDPAILASYTEGDELDLIWEFGIQQAVVDAVYSENSTPIAAALEDSMAFIPEYRFITFLSNHDMTRIMTELENNIEKAKSTAFLILTTPGVPFLYYGEEIGMQGGGDVEYETLLIPMQWTGQDNTPSWKEAWETVSDDYLQYNVEAEMHDPDSILSFYRELILLRNEHAALRIGNFTVLDSGSASIFSFLRVSQQERVLVIMNLSESSVTGIELSLDESLLKADTYSLSSLFGEDLVREIDVDENGGFSLNFSDVDMHPYEKYIFPLK